jgi:ubiquinone/menaquinone biosynthesis C-methylase UbiE
MTYENAKEHSRTTFDRIAETYENTTEGWHSRKMMEAALLCLGDALRGALLDVGCGPGLFLKALAEQNPELTLAGLDLSPEMIRVAKERLGTRADLRVGDAEALPWGDERFDHVVCIDSFHHYPNAARALAEMHRVLKRGARLTIADPTAPPVLRQLANAVNPLLHRGDVRLYDQREIVRLLKTQGFERNQWSRVGIWGFVITALA